MKKATILMVIATLSTAIFGQGTKDPEAKAIMDKALAKLKSATTFTASFELVKHVPNLGDEKSKGEIKFKDRKIYVKSDDGREIFNDGKTLSVFYEEDNEVNIYTSDPEENDDFNIDKYLKNYHNEYKYVYMGTENLNGVNCHKIELAPDKSPEEMKRMSVFKIKLYIRVSDHLLMQWQSYEKTGVYYSTLISNFKANVTLSDATFVFDKTKYPGVEEIDMRD